MGYGKFGIVPGQLWEMVMEENFNSDEVALACYLFTSPNHTSSGVYKLSPAMTQEELPGVRVKKAIESLSNRGFIAFDDRSRWVWIRRFLSWRPPANPSHRKGIIKSLDDIPTTLSFYTEFLESLKTSINHRSQQQNTTNGDTLQHSVDTVSTPSPHRIESIEYRVESIEEDNKPPLTPPVKRGMSGAKFSQAVTTLYGEILTPPMKPCPKAPIEQILSARKNYPAELSTLQGWEMYFRWVSTMPFLMGKVKRWTASLPWLVGPKNMAKVMGGFYDDAGAGMPSVSDWQPTEEGTVLEGEYEAL